MKGSNTNMKKSISVLVSSVILLSCVCPSFDVIALERYSANEENKCEISRRETELFDEFDGDTLNFENWLIADKSWGGNNGGLVPENVSVSDGTLKLEGHGNLYTGDIMGHNKSLGGKRTGAGIATRDYFSSGRYEIVAKVAPVQGACSAVWTFMYEENDEEISNHEIDIEIPTANATHSEPCFECARFNTYVTETKDNSQFMDLPSAVDDNKFHKYRFDWHTGSEKEEKRVDFFVDDVLICTSKKYVPTNASRLWIGIWFPCAQDKDHDGVCETGWTGTADFDTAVYEIDSVKITPFLEEGDTVQNESVPKRGWAPDSFPEDTEKENYEHIKNESFSNGNENWKLEGDAAIEDGKGLLSSGDKTDTIKQVIDVLPKTTYTFSVDVESEGPEAVVGVRKLNGEGCESVTVTNKGRTYVYYTTGDSVSQVEVFVQVLRYQNSKGKVYIDNASFKGGKITSDPVVTDETYITDVTDVTEPVNETSVTETTDVTDVSYLTDITDVTTEIPDKIKGDLDSDGTVNANDMNLLVSYLLSYTKEYDINTYDVNEDMTINVLDLIELKTILIK